MRDDRLIGTMDFFAKTGVEMPEARLDVLRTHRPGRLRQDLAAGPSRASMVPDHADDRERPD